MSENILLSIHYDGEIVYDEEGSIVFRSGQPIITYMTLEVNSLTGLKDVILHFIGQQESKRVKKIYYRYPTELDGNLFYKRYQLCNDEDVWLIRSWHNRWTNFYLLELYVFLVNFGGRGSSADTVDDSPTSGVVRRTIRRKMVDLNMPPEDSQEGSNVEVRNVDLMDDGHESHDGSLIRDLMMEVYEVNLDDGDDADEEPPEIPDDGDEEEEMNYYGDTQIALTQPAISRSYDRLDHFTRLNLDAMTSDWSFTQGGSEEDPSNEFERLKQLFRYYYFHFSIGLFLITLFYKDRIPTPFFHCPAVLYIAAASSLILLCVITHHSLPWSSVLLVAVAIAISVAFTGTGGFTIPGVYSR
ncbi:hypothetical protein AHAS_Ahas19G0224000 [Arachis hypogaea]